MRISGTPTTGADQRRFERFSVNRPTEVRSAEGNFQATLVDVSEGGAAVHLDKTGFGNDLFVALHSDGHEDLHGRIVRECDGGFALQFDDEEEQERARVEIEKFRATIGETESF